LRAWALRPRTALTPPKAVAHRRLAIRAGSALPPSPIIDTHILRE